MSVKSKIKTTKYAGADWLMRRGKFGVSPFGIKVANVLGQTFLGIYHIDDAVLSKKVLWGGFLIICVTVPGELATYDCDLLSRLVFCCRAAEISVSIYGSFKGYTKLVFSPEHSTIESVMGATIDELTKAVPHPGSDFMKFAPHFCRVRKLLKDYQESQVISVERIHWLNLQALVLQCHHYLIRCSLVGRSNYTLEAQFSQRRIREGSSVWDRHPTWAGHQKSLAGLINVDYTSVD